MSEKRIFFYFAITAVILMITVTSCDPSKKYEQQEQDQIDQYLSDNSNLNFELKPSGLYFLEVQAGTGDFAVKHDTVYVRYTGKLLNGTVFDSNVGKPHDYVFPVGEKYVIDGFDEAITYMKQGGKSLVLVPSKLGYGTSGYYTIGGYTPLLYDIELVKLVHNPSK